jgi:hypothetical protein
MERDIINLIIFFRSAILHGLEANASQELSTCLVGLVRANFRETGETRSQDTLKLSLSSEWYKRTPCERLCWPRKVSMKLVAFLLLVTSVAADRTFTVYNGCPFTIW